MRRTTTKNSFLKGLFLVLFALTLSFATVGCDDDNGTSTNQQPISGTITFKYDGVEMTADSMAAHFPHGLPDTADFPGYIRVAIMKTDASGNMLAQGPVAGVPNTGTYVGFKFSDITDGKYSYTKSLDEGYYAMLFTYVYTYNDNSGKASNTYIEFGHYGSGSEPAVIAVSGTPLTGLDMEIDVKVCEDTLKTLQFGDIDGTVTITNPDDWDTYVPAGSSLLIRGFREGSSLYGQPDFIYYPVAQPATGSNTTTYTKDIQFGKYTTLEVGVFTPPYTFKSPWQLNPVGQLNGG